MRRLGFDGRDPESVIRTDHVEWLAFPQTWGSTALGFGGMGGATMTTATTIVVRDRLGRSRRKGGKLLVYFGGRFCYEAPVDETFEEALARRRMPSRRDAEMLGARS